MSFEETIPNERLRRARFQIGFTQAELAEKVGTTFETVSRWERGIKAPSAYYRRKLCDVLGKTAEELGLLVESGNFFASDSSPCVFLSSAYSDAELKLVASLKESLQSMGVTVWSSRTIRRQETRNKRNVLQEAIRAAHVVLLIVSPHSLTSHHVHDTLRLARHFKRPVCAVWVDGEKFHEYISPDYGDPFAIIDAREEDEQVLHDKIVVTLERVWSAPGDPQTSGLPELEWKVPEKFTPLIGRDDEIARLAELLMSQQIRMVTLLGPGGVGKTHLGTKIALEMRERFADGSCAISLAGINDAALVIPAIAQGLGIRELGETSLFEQVKVALRNRHLLLFLDNFEQVLEAAPHLVRLLEECPFLKILVTSREKLRVQHEYEFPVPPLALPDMTLLTDIDRLTQCASVNLFIQRAQATKPDFLITSANVRVIAEICVRLDGLPLAIELAAARIRSLASQALLTRLDEHPLDVVMSRDQDLNDRQRTLRNTIAWSYNLLDEPEQRLFRRLCVFAGSFSVETIEELYLSLGESSSNVWEGVESLLDKSLLRSAEQAGEGRLKLLETIREYGLELLQASGEEEAIRQAHAEYYLWVVEEAEPHLKDEQQIMWLARLQQEQGNLRGALKWFADHQRTESLLRFCGALWWFWRLRGFWSEGRRWLEASLRLPQSVEPTQARAKVLCAAGDLAYYQDDYPQARELLEKSVMICRLLHANRELAFALGALGVLMQIQGDLEYTYAYLEESEYLCRSLSFSWELSYLLRKLAQFRSHAGALKQAIEYAQESLTLAQKLQDKSLIATTLSTLGDIAARQGDLAQALAFNQESLTYARELDDKLLIAVALNNLGYFSALQNDMPLITYAVENLALMRELGDKLLIARALHSLGYITSRQGQLNQARAWYRESLSLAQEIQNEREIGFNLWGLSMIAVVEGNFLQAAHLFGAVESRIDVKVDLYPVEQSEYEHARQHARTQLGSKAFAAAKIEGRDITLEQALSSTWSPAVPSPPPSPKYPDGLTEREVEVLCLLAKGYTDEQIARQLVIAPRTVNSHLTIIYRKIRVSSDGKERQILPRIAATRYVIEHDLC